MIPAQAVEAATLKLAYLNSDAGDQLSDEEWALAILEAAAPHMLAGAWDDAVSEGESSGWIHDYAADDLRKRNPYK